MGIEAIKGAGMSYQASASAPEIKAEAAHKVEVAEAPQVSANIARDTMAMNTKEASAEGGNAQPGSPEAQQAQIKRAVEEINKKSKQLRSSLGCTRRYQPCNNQTRRQTDKRSYQRIST